MSEKLVTEKKVVLAKDDPKRFEEGVNIKGKLFGVEDVKKETGDEICQTAMVKLKAVVSAKKEHKQQVNIRISLQGIEISDDKTSEILHTHAVQSISYIARDVNDVRAIGYIYKVAPNQFQYFGIKTKDAALELFNTLKALFETVLELRKTSKVDGEVKEPTNIPVENRTDTEKGLEAKIAQMNQASVTETVPAVQVPALVVTPVVIAPTKSYTTPETSLMDDDIPEEAPKPEAKKVNDDLFDLFMEPAPKQETAVVAQPFFSDDPALNMLGDKFSVFSSVEPQLPLLNSSPPIQSNMSQQQQYLPYQQPIYSQTPIGMNPVLQFSTPQQFYQMTPQQAMLQQQFRPPLTMPPAKASPGPSSPQVSGPFEQFQQFGSVQNRFEKQEQKVQPLNAFPAKSPE